MILLLASILSFIFLANPEEKPRDRNAFVPPLKIPLYLSANFGELRTNHFHSGIDIRTQGVTGKEVIASASGYIYRISISPGGFGKALYMRHPSGYSTVYAHLDRFVPEIEDFVKSKQYEEKSYMITLWPSKERFNFEKGEIIAYSGNTGSSGGPHLHFEIRKSDEEKPVNPLLFDFGVEDNFKPVIEKIGIYPIGPNSYVNGKNKAVKLNVSGSNGNYFIPSSTTISISGDAGFGIKSYDILNSANHKCSVYSIELRVDSNLLYSYQMDSFGFNETAYVNSHIDYETFIRDKTFFERTYLLPGNKLSIPRHVVNRGIYRFSGNKRHHIEIKVSDIHGNSSRLSFYATAAKPPDTAVPKSDEDRESAVVMPFERNNKFVSGNLAVTIPQGALYDTLWFRFSRSEASTGMYSPIYQVHDKFTPLHKAFQISIKPDEIPEGKSNKLLIIRFTENNLKTALPTTITNGVLTANSSSFGNFYVGIDTVPPTISPIGFSHGSDLTARESIRVRIRDDLSGIKSYYPLIDGKWALFEYDQKNDMLIYRFDPDRINRGSNHTLNLSISDNQGNIKKYECEFRW